MRKGLLNINILHMDVLVCLKMHHWQGMADIIFQSMMVKLVMAAAKTLKSQFWQRCFGRLL